MSRLHKRYKHIVWDWNGTLLDDTENAVTSINRVLNRRSMPEISCDQYMELFRFPVSDYYLKIGFDFAKEPFEKISYEFLEEYNEISQCSCRLHSNTEDVLKWIDNCGITQSILSAAHQEELERFLDLFDIRKYFIGVIGLDNYHAAGKIENGIKWVSSLPYDRKEILFIGDTIHDFEVSQAIGSDCALVACGHQHKSRLEACGVTVFDSLENVLSFL